MSSAEIEIQMEIKEENAIEYSFLGSEGFEDSPCDVTLESKDGGFVHAHKAMLSERSEYFKEKFSEKCEQNVFYFEEITYLVLIDLINFIYTGEMPVIYKKKAEEIRVGAELFILDEIEKECTRILSITGNGPIFVENNCTPYHSRPSIDVMLNCPDFLSKDVEYISKFIRNEYMFRNPEEDVYAAIMKWTKHDEKNRKQFLSVLLHNVKFELIPKAYIFEILHEPLVKEDPECLKMVEEAYKQSAVGQESAISTPIVEIHRSNKKKNLDNMHKPFVPRVQCLKKNSPSYGKMAINIIGTLDEDLSEDFQRIEWLLAMDETNFLKNWDEKWTDLKA